MLKKILFGCVVLFATSSSGFAGDGVLAAAHEVESALRSAEYLEGYFVNRTGTYSYSKEEIVKRASIRIYRACGANCANFARALLENMEKSAPTKCLDGQENVLIDIGGKLSLLYRQRGRLVEFEGKCFVNRQSINHLIEGGFWFN